MKAILTARDKIYDHIDDFSHCHWHVKASDDSWATYCIAKDTILDTGETLLCHREKGFSKNGRERYIGYYGVLQAIYLQQDSILALHQLFLGKPLKTFQVLPNWQKLRNLRNDTAGHPVKQMKSVNRNIISYDLVNYQSWSKGKRFPSSEDVPLGRLLDAYDEEAADVLDKIHAHLELECDSQHR